MGYYLANKESRERKLYGLANDKYGEEFPKIGSDGTAETFTFRL